MDLICFAPLGQGPSIFLRATRIRSRWDHSSLAVREKKTFRKLRTWLLPGVGPAEAIVTWLSALKKLSKH